MARHCQGGRPGRSRFFWADVSQPDVGSGIAGGMSQGAVGPCPGRCPGAEMDVAWANIRGRDWAFCGGLTVAAVAPPAAVNVIEIAAADAIVALDVKCINIKISVDY